MNHPFSKYLTLLATLACPCGVLRAADLHVAPDGKDSNDGSRSAPFRTLAAARDAARQFAGKEAVTVHVADGIYYLPETLVFSPVDSGSEKFPVTYMADHEGKAVLSGGLKLDLKWEAWKDGIYKAATPAGLAIDQLFLDGKRQRMARYPDFDPNKPTAAYQGYAADAISNERAARWADPAGGFIHAMHVAQWGGYHYRITGKKPDGSLAYEGGWQNNRQMGMHKEFRMVENIFEELDAPGEWYHDAKTNTLYFMPESASSLGSATVEVVRLRHLVECRGTSKAPVRFLTLQGFTYRHAARTFMDNKEPLLRSDWTIYRGGTVTLTGTENVSILDSEFDQVGGNAVFVNNYNRHALIKGCHIHDAGASGVCFVGDPGAVRAPLFEYAETQDFAKMDRTPGPKTDNYPADSAVEDCLIHGIGRVERQPAGVEISMSMGIAVRDTSIYDCARAGINIGDGCWGGHLLERCDVFDTVLETHDHGSFNSWGRDRYWCSNHRGVSQPEVQKDPNLPFLDAMKTTVIRDSRWRCDHGWDIDLDDGSTNYDIYNNVMLNGGLKFREGYKRIGHNNILVNGGFHPHVWFDASGDTFRHNIVMKAHANIGTPKDWGKDVDENFFTSESALDGSRQQESDGKSMAGDPIFVDPANGDFSVKVGSPALKVGFKNFPMDQFGVKKASLKAIARTPVIPELKDTGKVTGRENTKPPQYWLGSALHGIEGEEFSAFGVAREDGGVQLVEVPGDSAAAGAGLKSNDLVQAVNERKVRDTGEFLAALLAAGPSPVKLRVVRNQQARTLELPADTPFIVMEPALAPDGFTRLLPPKVPAGKASANRETHNDGLDTLVDGKLARGYGPVFSNGIGNGAYKIELAASMPVGAITAWSFNQDGCRACQKVTIYGSNAPGDPGWNTSDASKFKPLGTIDTGDAPAGDFVAASLRARHGSSLGTFRYIVWTVFPVNSGGENTAFQELAVEPAR